MPVSDSNIMRALAGEVAVSLHAIDRFLASDYGVSGDRIRSMGKLADSFDYVTCSTAVFDSLAGKAAVHVAAGEVRDRLIRVYDGFRRINR